MGMMKLVKIMKLTIVMLMMMLKTTGQNNRQRVPACKQGEASASDKSGTGGAS